MKQRLFPPSYPYYPFVLCLIYLLHVGITPAWGQSGHRQADFLIIENPRALTIYNKYEQTITFQESRLFQKSMPLEIVERDGRLSDSFTRCMSVTIDNENFFLLKNETGSLVNVDLAGDQVLLERCAVLSDTVQILTDSSFRLSKRPGITGTGPLLKEGTLLRRLIRKGKYDYVQTLSRPFTYGWVDLKGAQRRRAWDIVRRKSLNKADALPEDIRRRIQAHIREINDILIDLFTQLNHESSQIRPIPQWSVEDTGIKVTLKLNDPTYTDQFSESIQYTVNELDNLVRGTGFGVYYMDGLIEVRRK